MSDCKCGCGHDVVSVPGKQAREFWSDACRKRFSRQKQASSPDKPGQPNHGQSCPDIPTEDTESDKSVGSQYDPFGGVIEDDHPDAIARGTCQHVKQANASGKGSVINLGHWKPAHALVKGQYNRVSLPGDADYSQPRGIV